LAIMRTFFLFAILFTLICQNGFCDVIFQPDSIGNTYKDNYPYSKLPESFPWRMKSKTYTKELSPAEYSELRKKVIGHAGDFSKFYYKTPYASDKNSFREKSIKEFKEKYIKETYEEVALIPKEMDVAKIDPWEFKEYKTGKRMQEHIIFKIGKFEYNFSDKSFVGNADLAGNGAKEIVLCCWYFRYINSIEIFDSLLGNLLYKGTLPPDSIKTVSVFDADNDGKDECIALGEKEAVVYKKISG